ncbi:MAG: alpha/beta hydrolase [Chloroflexi bacterium]|nr:alpha/beta hydrolase [Chloroflexota bacterium]MCH7654911.1 alpha/beta hydrolase [Chloroflexota bacterium]
MTVTIGTHEIPNAEERYVKLNHGTTRYIEAGSGYPTILVHGVGYTGGAHNWLLNIGPLSSKLRVLAVDCPAWGKGEGQLGQEYSFAYLVDFIREFQDALGLEKTNLVGHSMGGWLASLFGYESPNRLNKLVLVASGGAMPRQLKTMVEFKPPERDQILDGLKHTVKDASVDLEALADYNFALTDNPARLAAYRNVLTHMNNMETRERYNTVRRFGHIDVPTLVVWGRNDQTNALEMGEMTHRGIPGSKMVVFDCGHFIPTEAPDELNAALLDFLPD